MRSSGRGVSNLEPLKLEPSNLEWSNLGPARVRFRAAHACCVTLTSNASTSRGGGIFRRP